MNDLLDEALIETFPASDPIAISFELEITRARNSYNTRGFTLRSEVALRRGRGSGDWRPRRP